MAAIRSLLFVPGNKENMLEKAESFDPDVLVPDMEDSVPDAEKANARDTISVWLPKYRGHSALIMPRVNSPETGLIEDDLATIVGPDIWGVSVGKINTAQDLAEVSNIIAKLEDRAGIEIGSLMLIPWIETAQAIVHCHEIATASDRIAGLAFGAEDYTNDLGVEPANDETQLLYARSVLCTAARAANVLALETPYFQVKDQRGLEADSQRAKRIGFKGRFAIHPDQIETINASFAPTAEEIAHARRVVEAFEAAEREGRGSTSLDGSVIDVPVFKRARAVLDLAEKSLGRR